MQRQQTTAKLVRWAIDAGFDRAGVATLEPSATGAALRRWLARGEHAGMEWIVRRIAVREDPARLLPGARSALCVALQYHPLAGEAEPDGDLWPRVARYARGRDYHDVMGRRLRTLAAKISDAFPGCETRPYVDTGPILERELAARAGLGAVAKNTHLLHRRGGSYFFLGELLLTLDLEPAEPAEPAADLCGRCTRCLDACPTGALPEPYRLDANRCISYWTIEHRGDLPQAAREMVGEWVFGCDVCQQVCPYNQRPEAGGEPLLRLPPERRELDLAGLLALGRDGWVERFQVSPMKRAKLDGLRRNAAVAMGNRGDPAYVPALSAALAGAPPGVRRHAAWALGRIAAAGGGGGGDGGAGQALRDARDAERDAGVRREIESALAALRA
jgi:epoxyqueuosine reductase